MWKSAGYANPPPSHTTIAVNTYRIGDAVTLGGDRRVYAATQHAVGPFVLQWPNITQPGTFNTSSALVGPGGNFDPTDICWDSVNNCGYVAFPGSPDFVTMQVSIFKFDSSLTISTIVNAATITAPGVTASSGAICTDGTYIYYLAGAGGASYLYKYLISDGSQAASIQMTNPGGGSNTPGNGDIIGLMTGNGAGSLYCGGFDTAVLGRSWIAKVPTSLGSITSVVNVTGVIDISDDSCAVGNFFWFTDEKSYPCQIVRAANSDLSTSLVTIQGSRGLPGITNSGADGIWYDGTYVWATATGDGTLSAVDPTGLSVVSTHYDIPAVSAAFFTNKTYVQNELMVVPGGSGAFFVSGQFSSAVSNVAYVNLSSGV